jgi:hypothetical protein
MGSPRALPTGYFPIQTRVSKGRNPELYAHLAREAQNGEAPGAVIRRLAEEALMLRNHPLTRALQAIDIKGESRTSFHTAPPGGLEQTNQASHTAHSPISAQQPAKVTESPAPKASASGSQAMAAALVSRMPVGPATRG